MKDKKIAILIPCYNEEFTIEKVIDDFERIMPYAKIYVYDNNSTDNTYKIACKKKVTVRKESKRGKGNVVRSMLRDIEADYYILIDGDDTYPVASAETILYHLIHNNCSMVVGDRHRNGSYKKENKRLLHNAGNNLVKKTINKLYKSNLNDIMSGFRAFDKEFAIFFPAISENFELETEMSIFALDKKLKINEIPIEYKDRPEGSFSKLNTYLDGAKVIKTIFSLFKNHKPLQFFTFVSIILLASGITIGTPVIYEFIQTGFVKKIPSAILASSVVILSFLSLFIGFILDTSASNHRELFEQTLKQYRFSKKQC